MFQTDRPISLANEENNLKLPAILLTDKLISHAGLYIVLSFIGGY